MKIAITGKGGVGKTTIAALLSQTAASRGMDVFAVDADPSPCLAEALGFPSDLRKELRPIVEMENLIEERTGARPGASGGFFTINPRVDDIPDRFSVLHRGVRLLEMGAVQRGGSGCICPESAMLKTLFTHMLLRKDEILILDMYAGVEHLGRSTVDFVDAMLIVVEPTHRSIGTARQIKQLAEDLGLENLFLVGNKLRNAEDAEFLIAESPDLPVIGIFHELQSVIDADHIEVSVYDFVPELRISAEDMLDRLLEIEH